MSTNGTLRSLTVFALLAAALTFPGGAGAQLLTTDEASDCDPNTSQAFARWGDTAFYRLAPGGGFEGTSSWSLANGAKTVAGNEPFGLVPGRRSLSLPAGAVATSPTMCFAFGDWHARFLVRNTGSTSARLEVDVLVHSLLGVVSTLDGGELQAGSKWAPSPRMSALLTNVGGLAGSTKAISFRLRARGSGAAFQVDSFFLDPFKSR